MCRKERHFGTLVRERASEWKDLGVQLLAASQYLCDLGQVVQTLKGALSLSSTIVGVTKPHIYYD